MPIFAAVGAYVAGTILGLVGTAAVVVGAIVATATAFVVSRVINGNPNKGGNAAAGSQGGRIQVPPATNNKIPVLYGNAFINGIITDARIVNENKTMYYCIVLSETTSNQFSNSVYTVNNVFYNDLRLTAVDSGANSHKVKDGRKKVDGPGEDFIDTNFVVDGNSLVELRVYAGSSSATDQILPAQSTGNTQAAFNFWGNNDGSWLSTHEMRGLVFAIVKITYNGEKGFTALPNMTFKLNNSKNNPADAWFDYMTSQRYGADIDQSYIDQTAVSSALAQWRTYCDEQITYTPIEGGSTTQKRYTLNGVIDTNRAVKENIDIILQNAGAWLSYNVVSGTWQPIIKRAATGTEISTALAFSDDNIISGISISSTRLEDLYNSFEAEFYDKHNRDQKAYARLSLPDNLRNPNEPNNQLRLSLDLVNNSVQAELLGQIELRQSRDDLVIEFQSSSFGIQAQAGDVIGVTNPLYDWSPKYFRVMRVKEIETAEGGLIANIQALEYNEDVYTVEPITEFTTSANVGIGVQGSSPNLPEPPRVVITELDTDVPVPYFYLQVEIPSTGGPFDEIELYYTEGWDPISITGSITGNTLTVSAADFGVINSGDFFEPVGLGQFNIVQQLTNTPASITHQSGGAVATNTVTFTDTTGLIVGNTITGTGLPESGSLILQIQGNQLTLEEYFTIQAAGTYLVRGGLGTYLLDASVTGTVTGTVTLFDLPLDVDFKFLKKTTPAGNTPTFINGETITITILDVPANTETYRRWFIKARMGIKQRYSRFSQPGTVDRNGNFRYTPNPVGGGELNNLFDVNIVAAEEGQILYYDDDTDKWRNTSILKIVDNVAAEAINITGNANISLDLAVDGGNITTSSGLGNLFNNDGVTTVNIGFGATTEVNLGRGGQGRVQIKSPLLEAQGDAVIALDLAVNGGDITSTSSVGNLFNNDGVTTVNIGNGAATEVNLGRTGAGRVQIKSPLLETLGDAVIALDLAVNGGDITSTAAQGNLFNGGVTDINIGNESVATRLGKDDAASEVVIKPGNLVGVRATQHLFNTVATDVNAFGDAIAVNIGANTGVTTIAHDLTVNGGNINLNGIATAAEQPFITFQTQPDGVNSLYGIRGTSALDDPWFIGSGSTGDDEGFLEIAIGDNAGGTNNGGEIYVRQYNGAAPLNSVPWFGGNGVIVNELILLDNLGHTVIPNNLTVDSGTLFVDSVNNRLGVNTLSPSREVSVVGNADVTGDVLASSFTVDSRASIDTATLTTISTATVTLDSTQRNTLKALINILDNVTQQRHCVEILAMRKDASEAVFTTYAEMYTGASALATFTADVSGGLLRIRITPTSTNNRTFTLVRTSLT